MPKTNVVVEFELRGPSGNVFAVAGAVVRALTKIGRFDLAGEFSQNLMKQGNYDAVLAYARQFVNLVAVDEDEAEYDDG